MPRKCPDEFRRDVVRAARASDAPVEQIARDFGVSKSALWIAPGLVEGLIQRKDAGHASSEEVPDEMRERAARLVRDKLAETPGLTVTRACRQVGEQLGINTDTLRNWVKQARIDAGEAPGTTTDDAQRIAQLEKENRELRRANTILRQASAYFAQAELDRQ